MILGAIENWNVGATHGGEQTLGRLDRAMGIDTAAVGILRIEVHGSAGAAAIDKIVEIDGQESDRRSDKGLACVWRVQLHVGLGNYVFPAMVFECFLRRHGGLQLRSECRRILIAGSRPSDVTGGRKSMLFD